ncbi:hypothetical protein H2248_000141 [Termitomyces sp. 'cryptogamus']|nr:hypothetical protein H2248_000141 [Termitomyces sp. 'cryptogamus']
MIQVVKYLAFFSGKKKEGQKIEPADSAINFLYRRRGNGPSKPQSPASLTPKPIPSASSNVYPHPPASLTSKPTPSVTVNSSVSPKMRPTSMNASHHVWSSLDLDLCPPIVPAEIGPLSPEKFISPSPFPRHGHAVPATATSTGDIYIFGGSVDNVARNDIYLLSTRYESVGLLPN